MQASRLTLPFAIRPSVEADASAMLEIYRPFVETSTVSFELNTPSIAVFQSRIAKVRSGWQWLVAERGHKILGYAYGSMHRERPAYQWSVEVSAYVDPDQHRQGIGRALYLQLFEELGSRGFCNAYAGVTLPNDASVGLHTSVGFSRIGVFARVGHKFGRWHDVAWFQRELRSSPRDGK
ncbi:MAG: N-acetyltransferase family protein [Pseudomonadota bacterium]|nr:N-acetyltransferase family protein [Pseudomonadota bacterium]